MNGDGGIPWNVLLFLPVQALALAVGIGIAALLLGRGWDRDHTTPAAEPQPATDGLWSCTCAVCGTTFNSRDRKATTCPSCARKDRATSPQPATQESRP